MTNTEHGCNSLSGNWGVGKTKDEGDVAGNNLEIKKSGVVCDDVVYRIKLHHSITISW